MARCAIPDVGHPILEEQELREAQPAYFSCYASFNDYDDYDACFGNAGDECGSFLRAGSARSSLAWDDWCGVAPPMSCADEPRPFSPSPWSPPPAQKQVAGDVLMRIIGLQHIDGWWADVSTLLEMVGRKIGFFDENL
jgi:hypothetical protein